MSYDLFVSYRHLDAERVRPLVEALRSQGLSVWFDESVIEDFAPITDAIRDGLAQSKALLAWYSAAYPQSRPCQMELTAAYIAAGQASDPASMVLVVNPEAGTDHILPEPLRDNLFLPSDTALAELADRIASHLATLTGSLGAILPITASAQFGARFTGSSSFVGRLVELWNLHGRLHQGEHAIVSGQGSRPGLALVAGMGGQGKSLLAEEYALRFGAAYPGGIFWLRSQGQDPSGTGNVLQEQESIRDSAFRDIAQRLGVTVQGRSLVEVEGELGRALRQNGQPFLWVVDDLASGLAMEAVRRWQAPDTNGKTLITTRSREYGTAKERLDLDVLEPDETLQLFLSHRQEQQAPLSEEDEQMAREIAVHRLGCHALAVDVAGGAVQRIGHGDFLQKLDTPDEDALELAAQLGGQLPNGHEKDIAATLLRSLTLLDEAGLDYLRLAACLATAPIPRSLISQVFAKADGLEPAQAEIRALLATDQAANLSLAEDLPGEQYCQTVHTLIARTVRFHDPAPERAEHLRNIAVAVLIKALAPVADIRKHATLASEVEHGRHLCRSIVDDVNLASLAGWVARHDLTRGNYATAKTLYTEEQQHSMPKAT